MKEWAFPAYGFLFVAATVDAGTGIAHGYVAVACTILIICVTLLWLIEEVSS